MGSKTGFRIAGRRPMGWVFAFVLSVTQVYPAFGACICLDKARETVEVSIPSEDAASCCPSAAQPTAREEMDSGGGRHSKEADRGDSNTRISRGDCCEVDSGWIPPLPASLSRTVEVRPSFDTMPWTGSEDAGTLFPRFDRLVRGTEPGIHVGFGTALYLLNASLLI